MIKQRKATAILTIVTAVIVSGLFLSGPVRGGDLEPSGSPSSTMHTLDEIYNKLDINYTIYPARVERTGQTTCYNSSGTAIDCSDTGQDGEHQSGVAWPDPRFTDNEDGTVTDNLTGLVWLQNANKGGTMTWAEALTYCNNLADDGSELTDGSVAGDWRLPNIKELQSLIEFSNYAPVLPAGHPFTDVQAPDATSSDYWSGNTSTIWHGEAWDVNMYNGTIGYGLKSHTFFVWPVRGGN